MFSPPAKHILSDVFETLARTATQWIEFYKVGPPHRILLRWDPAKVIARPATSLGNYADLFRVLIENLDLFVVRGDELMPTTSRFMCPSTPLPIPLATITSSTVWY